ncbi:hypothetical protein BU16DRAFT_524204 [Lophium mytilinum]|uniref:Diphthamide biosynthesis protein 4 n=1 Tax=Lophium mytilinum TaxID=390894 RepID=A0A6A6R5B0_9PEZI|nr:hypothetical protein BU16DRAFT_524204 [Lophium mytilinum]
MARHHNTTLAIYPNAYAVLALPSPSEGATTTTAIPADEVRKAFRAALLRWHPDKTAANPGNTAIPAKEAGKEAPAYSVDDITAAYRTLSSPVLRRELDEHLATHFAALQLGASGRGQGERGWLAGLEVVDLEELVFEEEGGSPTEAVWYKSCRCGSKRGFVVRERELEEALEGQAEGAKAGEVLVGCRGCSLWIRVGFGVVEG